jgi:hypothetical protein
VLDFETKEHPSFGAIGWSRINGQIGDLFGSSIEHHSIVRLRIYHAGLDRGLNNDWIHAQKPIIEVDMSPNQFSDFLTSPNMSDNVPCTIRYIENVGNIKGIKIESKREVFENEFNRDMQDIGKNFGQLEEHVKTLGLSGKKLQELQSYIYEVKRIITDRAPFAQKQFNEQLDKSVTEAKATIEAFTETKIRQIGIDAVIKSPVKLLE